MILAWRMSPRGVWPSQRGRKHAMVSILKQMPTACREEFLRDCVHPWSTMGLTTAARLEACCQPQRTTLACGLAIALSDAATTRPLAVFRPSRMVSVHLSSVLLKDNKKMYRGPFLVVLRLPQDSWKFRCSHLLTSRLIFELCLMRGKHCDVFNSAANMPSYTCLSGGTKIYSGKGWKSFTFQVAHYSMCASRNYRVSQIHVAVHF